MPACEPQRREVTKSSHGIEICARVRDALARVQLVSHHYSWAVTCDGLLHHDPHVGAGPGFGDQRLPA